MACISKVCLYFDFYLHLYLYYIENSVSWIVYNVLLLINLCVFSRLYVYTKSHPLLRSIYVFVSNLDSFLFSCSITLAGTFSTINNRIGENILICLLAVEKNLSNFHHFIWGLLGFVIWFLYQLKFFLLTVFIMKRWWILTKFSLIYFENVNFFPFFYYCGISH